MHPLSIFSSTNVVILYHNVPSSDWFRSSLKLIGKMYKFIPIDSIETYFNGEEMFNNCCHITFDDGDKTVYDKAFPVLKEMNINASLFVSPSIIQKGSNYWFQEIMIIRKKIGDDEVKRSVSHVMGCDLNKIRKYQVGSILKSMKITDINNTIEYIKERNNIVINQRKNINIEQLYDILDSEIINIGAHTMNHPILANETEEIAKKEIVYSIKNLSNLCGKSIKHFAYPNGTSPLDFNDREKDILFDNGIKLSFTTNSNFYNKRTDTMAIPRIGFSGNRYENRLWILGKLFLVQIWDQIKYRLEMEKMERKEIKDIGLI